MRTSHLKENFVGAMRALIQSPLRSGLTMSGIIIGVLSSITLVAILQGVKQEIRKQVEGLGANLVLVVPGKLDENGQPNPMAMIGISTLSDRDVASLAKVPGVSQISPVVFVSGNVEDKTGKNVSALVVGTNRQGIEMNPTPLTEGRYFTPAEENQNVCVICDRPRHDLFGNGPVLGRSVRVKYKDWKVVGVLSKPRQDDSLIGHMMGLGNLVYLPAAAAKREFPTAQINRIVLKTDFKHPAHDLVTDLKDTMLTSHSHMEDFGVMTQEKGLALVVKLVSMAQSLLVLIAAISLVVAGVGIMNIMLVTVTERTREIGIRKTVGARNVDILQQFLIEAIILALLGGTVGLSLSGLLCFLIGKFSPLTPVLGIGAISLALIVCVCVGLLFGVAPALRASKLNPIDALRHE